MDAAWRRSDPTVPDWTIGEHLLARAVEAVEHLGWLTQLVNVPRGKRASITKPKPVPRPGTPRPADRRPSTGGKSTPGWKRKLGGLGGRITRT